jgi:prevent-host-death family protein
LPHTWGAILAYPQATWLRKGWGRSQFQVEIDWWGKFDTLVYQWYNLYKKKEISMVQVVNLATARKNLPELTDRAYAGQTFLVARRGRELAVLLGIEEYHRLKELEREQREQDFAVLLTPHPSALSEEEARELAVRTVRKIRVSEQQPSPA